MNRPIKFRAWDFENKVMHTPKIQDDQTFVLQLNCNYMGEFNGKKYEPIKMILMQFTGLHDRNGREIYEGDIVKQDNYSMHLKVVWNSLGRFCLEFEDGKHNDFIPHPMVEIIGNIYQHNHLLNHD